MDGGTKYPVWTLDLTNNKSVASINIGLFCSFIRTLFHIYNIRPNNASESRLSLCFSGICTGNRTHYSAPPHCYFNIYNNNNNIGIGIYSNISRCARFRARQGPPCRPA
jgi:hypothetical protein